MIAANASLGVQAEVSEQDAPRHLRRTIVGEGQDGLLESTVRALSAER